MHWTKNLDVESVHVGKDGKDGKIGIDGKDGVDGLNGTNRVDIHVEKRCQRCRWY